MLAGVGLAFMVLGLLLYRRRDLECAGDAVAFPVLVPVFQVLCAIFVSAAGQMFLYTFTGMDEQNFLVLAVGLVVGWYIGKMLLERSTRVFTLKNFYGLAVLTAFFAVSLWMTHVDALGIETRLPKAETIKSVTFGSRVFEEQEDIENFLALNRDALENRADNWGTYVLVDGEWIEYVDTYTDRIDEENPDNRYTYVDSVNLTYELTNGKIIRRRYNIWMDNEYVSSEAGRIARDYLTRWDTVNSRTIEVKGVEYNRLDYILQDVSRIYVDFMDGQQDISRQEVLELVAAIQADCAEGHMAQSDYYHTGYFRVEDEYAENGYYDIPSIGISIANEEYSWWISIYADSHNTIAWLQAHDLLNAEVHSGNILRY
jgi:ABC-2 type transport system permease protein